MADAPTKEKLEALQGFLRHMARESFEESGIWLSSKKYKGADVEALQQKVIKLLEDHAFLQPDGAKQVTLSNSSAFGRTDVARTVDITKSAIKWDRVLEFRETVDMNERRVKSSKTLTHLYINSTVQQSHTSYL